MIQNLKHRNKINLKVDSNSHTQEAQYYDMLVFCHLRWEFVYQRPQHLISRLAQNIKVLFIEEPLLKYNDSSNSLGNLIVVNENLHILQPNVEDIKDIVEILPHFVQSISIDTAWFYSPAFCPLLKHFNFETVVYDCMDELSLFKGAPQLLIEQEKFLMANADIVFTGGKSLYDSKKRLHYNVHCFPSSVDAWHFSQTIAANDIPSDIATIKKPIVGYFGVIDERIDLQLIQEAARKSPEVSFVMIGPLAKIQDHDLPKENNIHYLGMKSYNELPFYLNAFDIAMMPFALNDATKYISPTKTLEYMAAGKPIISTNITDVVRDYSHCVTLIRNSNEFCAAIELIFGNKNSFLIPHDYDEILKRTSWDTTAGKMNQLVNELQNEKY